MASYDAIVIGAGPAGLTAATYLARFRRQVLVLDGGPSRASWIPESHNTPGFPQGVGGDQLLGRLRAQAQTYGAVIREGRVTGLAREGDLFEIAGLARPIRSRTVLLAAGIVDHIPPIEGIEAAIGDSRVRMCPICDAFEAIDRKIAVLSQGPLGAREAMFLQTYSSDVTILALDGESEPAPGGAPTLPVALEEISFALDKVIVRKPGRPEQRFDHLYLALGCTPQAELARACGAQGDESGALLVDAHQMSSVPGLYAAGDVVRGLNQIAVAAGEAAIAATAIHNRLRDTSP